MLLPSPLSPQSLLPLRIRAHKSLQVIMRTLESHKTCRETMNKLPKKKKTPELVLGSSLPSTVRLRVPPTWERHERGCEETVRNSKPGMISASFKTPSRECELTEGNCPGGLLLCLSFGAFSSKLSQGCCHLSCTVAAKSP